MFSWGNSPLSNVNYTENKKNTTGPIGQGAGEKKGRKFEFLPLRTEKKPGCFGHFYSLVWLPASYSSSFIATLIITMIIVLLLPSTSLVLVLVRHLLLARLVRVPRLRLALAARAREQVVLAEGLLSAIIHGERRGLPLGMSAQFSGF